MLEVALGSTQPLAPDIVVPVFEVRFYDRSIDRFDLSLSGLKSIPKH